MGKGNMWYTGWSLLILQKCLMFLIFFLSLFIIIFIWNNFKRIKHYSMEKVTRGLLESFHECLICKNYIRSRKMKVSQAERHAQQVQSKLDSKLLIPLPPIGHTALCPKGLSLLILDHSGEWHCQRVLMDNVFPFYFSEAPSICLCCLTSPAAEQRKRQWYFMWDHWMIPSYPNCSWAHLFPHCFLWSAVSMLKACLCLWATCASVLPRAAVPQKVCCTSSYNSIELMRWDKVAC